MQDDPGAEGVDRAVNWGIEEAADKVATAKVPG
jgi:hypothetical protein